SPVASVTGSASMSPRRRTAGPGRPPRSTAVTDVDDEPSVISRGSPSSAASAARWVCGRSRPISGRRCSDRLNSVRSACISDASLIVVTTISLVDLRLGATASPVPGARPRTSPPRRDTGANNVCVVLLTVRGDALGTASRVSLCTCRGRCMSCGRPTAPDLEAVAGALGDGGVLVLSGAGLSTESGIPDYRGAGGSLSRHTPMTYQDFVAGAGARRRYWARSHLGRRTFVRARPNAGHRAVAAFARHGLLSGVITQNVDGLHQAAGSDDVVELHGSLDRVVCLSCGALGSREELAARLEEANPGFDPVAAAINPDGDADLT